ncbi:solute carrier family 46 member 3 [Lingula anatina]|uniref:Solute carrier family 46 member 3 n=1 Tax=Lingula anatina TaxID=7574 RepID=A0A1S3KG05_LINAN|nr:solute carrier family 46 member 3 [Lingula anatina]|eukprot:XP_013421394.1 solute carrier family 46 member 3 [Lingula anatina]
MTLRDWWREHKHDLRTVITVEPLTFLFTISLFLTFPASQALYIQKLCLAKYKDDVICNNLSAYHVQQDYVQTETSRFFLYSISVDTLLAMGSALFMGSWGDKINRKIPMILPITGQILANVNYFINSFNPDWPVPMLLISPVFAGTMGGFATYLLSVFSYVSVVSQGAKERIIRLSITEGILQLGAAVALVISGPLVERLGFSVTFGVSVASATLSLLYTVFWIRDPAVKTKNTGDEGEEKKRSLCSKLFDCSHIIESVKCYFKVRKGYRRFVLWSCLVIFMVIMVTLGGSFDISLLFLRYSIPNWTLTLYGIYTGLKNALQMLGLLVILPLFKRFLALEDTSLVIIGQVSSVLGQVLLAFSNTVWMVMLVPFAGMLSGLSSAALRSIVAKMVGPDEQGKAFAFLGCAQALSILMASLIFNNLYPATLHFLPGLSYLICALFTVAVMALTIVMRCYMPVEETTNTQDDQTLDKSALVMGIEETEQYMA